MAYKVKDAAVDTQNLLNENISLKKEIKVLEVANKQLLEEMQNYKNAYERYSNFFLFRLFKKIFRKES